MKTIKAKVHRLPTEGDSHILYRDSDDKLIYHSRLQNNKGFVHLKTYHLYFTTDEEIKEGDWFINTGSGGHPTPKVYQANSENSKAFKEFGPYPEIRKIIATTDPKLTIKYDNGVRNVNWRIDSIKEIPLPQPPQSFIEEYCKAGGIDEVLVEGNEIRFPLKERMGIEEYEFIPKLNPDNTIIIHPVEEKMYSREEIVRLMINAISFGNGLLQVDSESQAKRRDKQINKWIEDNL